MSKFLKIYFWQIISLMLNLVSMFIITPYLSGNIAIFGVYTVIISTAIFLAYADLGFLSAAMKFAGEYVVRNEREKEIKTIGFAGFIFFSFIIIYALVLLILAYNPTWLVKNLVAESDINITRNLLIIMALFAPVAVMQRIVQIIYSVRMEEYKFQRVLIVFNLFKITSVFYFFGNEKYALTEYYLFTQFCSLFAVTIGLYNTKRLFNYNIRKLFRSFKFSKEIYADTKAFAFTNLFSSLCWILYYELDLIVIGRMLGAAEVAVFAIGLTMLSYFRTLYGIFYSPFITRFNYFVGLKDHAGFKEFFLRIAKLGIAFTAFPVLIIAISANLFVLNWVGSAYANSISIARVLLLSFVFGFISNPAGIAIIAYEKLKLINVTSALLPLIYWFGIWLSYKHWGLQSFANFKLLAFAIDAVVYSVAIAYLFNLKVHNFIFETVYPALPALIFIGIATYFLSQNMVAEKSKINLLIYLFYCGIIYGISCILYYFCSKEYKRFVNELIDKLFSFSTK